MIKVRELKSTTTVLSSSTFNLENLSKDDLYWTICHLEDGSICWLNWKVMQFRIQSNDRDRSYYRQIAGLMTGFTQEQTIFENRVKLLDTIGSPQEQYNYFQLNYDRFQLLHNHKSQIAQIKVGSNLAIISHEEKTYWTSSKISKIEIYAQNIRSLHYEIIAETREEGAYPSLPMVVFAFLV